MPNLLSPGTLDVEHKRSLAAAVANPDSYATTLAAVLIDLYGTEALDWSPETIVLELRQDLGCDLTGNNLDQLCAAISLLTSDDFYRRAPRFVTLCNTLAGSPSTPDEFDPADPSEVAWGVTEALLLAPPENQDDLFSEEIREYVRVICREYGLTNPPDILGVVAGQPVDDPLFTEATNDPAMYGAFWTQQQQRSRDILAMIRGNLLELCAQLESLRLSHGDTRGLVGKIRKGLGVVSERA